MISVLDAAKILVADYAGTLTGERLDLSGVQSTITEIGSHKILIIRGTNEAGDWLKYNFRALPQYGPGHLYRWHRGFLQHAQVAYAFAKGKQIDLVIGHSLGAAAAGIVALSLSLPAITFATPRALYGEGPTAITSIRNFCRIDDLITMLPPALFGFRHLGLVRWLNPLGRHSGEDHTLIHYLELLEGLDDLDE